MIPRKILVCTDFSENSVPARILAIEFAKAFEAELLILHVVSSRLTGYPNFASQYPKELAMIQEHIQAGVEEELVLLGSDCRREVENVRVFSRSGAPADEIVDFAREESAGLIVMGTHGWSGAKRFLLGSTAEKVVRNAPCPVLTVRS